MSRYRTRFPLALGLAVIFAAYAFPVHAHDSWISRGALRNSVGEWCCGDNDCETLNSSEVVPTADGYFLKRFHELVPYSEAPPINPEGTFVRCHRPDGSRRCFFAPPESY